MSNRMNNHRLCVLAGLFVAILALAHESSASCVVVSEEAFEPNGRTINFEVSPSGAPIAQGANLQTVYQSLGVTFDENDRVAPENFLIHSAPNVGDDPNGAGVGEITAMFSVPVRRVGAWGFDFEMKAFDEGGQLLGTVHYSGDGQPGLFGESEFAFIGLSCTSAIAKATFGNFYPAQHAFGFHIDDLRFGGSKNQCDVNASGSVTTSDAQTVLRAAVGIADAKEVCCPTGDCAP